MIKVTRNKTRILYKCFYHIISSYEAKGQNKKMGKMSKMGKIGISRINFEDIFLSSFNFKALTWFQVQVQALFIEAFAILLSSAEKIKSSKIK